MSSAWVKSKKLPDLDGVYWVRLTSTEQNHQRNVNEFMVNITRIGNGRVMRYFDGSSEPGESWLRSMSDQTIEWQGPVRPVNDMEDGWVKHLTPAELERWGFVVTPCGQYAAIPENKLRPAMLPVEFRISADGTRSPADVFMALYDAVRKESVNGLIDTMKRQLDDQRIK